MMIELRVGGEGESVRACQTFLLSISTVDRQRKMLLKDKKISVAFSKLLLSDR